VGYDFIIRRRDGDDPIERQVWHTWAIDAVALVQLAASSEQRDGIVFPAFGLYGAFGHPVLFWQEGVVVVKYATDDHLSDLRLIAGRLRSELVRTDTP
jgi:hypothetical protein